MWTRRPPRRTRHRWRRRRRLGHARLPALLGRQLGRDRLRGQRDLVCGRRGVQLRHVHAGLRGGGEQPRVDRLRLLRGRHGRGIRAAAGRVLHGVRREHVARAGPHQRRLERPVDRSRAVREAAAGAGPDADVRCLRSGRGPRARPGRDPVPRVRAAGDPADAERDLPGARGRRHRRADQRRWLRQGIPHHDRPAGRRVPDAAVRRRARGGDRCVAAVADERVGHELHRRHRLRRDVAGADLGRRRGRR